MGPRGQFGALAKSRKLPCTQWLTLSICHRGTNPIRTCVCMCVETGVGWRSANHRQVQARRRGQANEHTHATSGPAMKYPKPPDSIAFSMEKVLGG